MPQTAPEASQIVEQWIGYALVIARQWGRRHPHLGQDFDSEAGYALWRVALKFDPARGKFKWLLKKAVDRAIITRLRNELSRNPVGFRPQAAAGEVDPLTVTADAKVREVGWELETADEFERLQRRMAGIDPRDVEALRQRAVDELTLKEVGANLGVTNVRVRQIVARAVKKLKGPDAT